MVNEMPKMYREGSRPCDAEKSQVEAMEEAGWSTEKPKAAEIKADAGAKTDASKDKK